jgi:N-acetylneuraminic acid mutarotase
VTWADGKLVVWGGVLPDHTKTNSGAVYDPETDTWDELPTLGAPSSTERHSAAWTGDEFIVFGGFDSLSDIRGQGGVFTPVTRKWTSFFSESAMGRTEHSAIWNGESLVVFGGKSKRLRTYLNNVAQFNPQSLSWTSKQGLNAPVEREGHSAVWTGTSMIVFGGAGADSQLLGDGGVYFP